MKLKSIHIANLSGYINNSYYFLSINRESKHAPILIWLDKEKNIVRVEYNSGAVEVIVLGNCSMYTYLPLNDE